MLRLFLSNPVLSRVGRVALSLGNLFGGIGIAAQIFRSYRRKLKLLLGIVLEPLSRHL